MKFNKIKKLVTLVVVLLLSSCSSQTSYREFKTMEDLTKAEKVEFANCNNNVSYNNIIEEDIPNAEMTIYSNYYDTFMEVANKKRDVAFVFSSVFTSIHDAYPSLKCIKSDRTIPIAAIFSNTSLDLKDDFDNFVKENPKLIEELSLIHMDNYQDCDIVYDFSTLENKQGSFTFAVNLANMPAEYLHNGMPTGFEIALVYNFAKERGYAVKLIDSEFSSVVAGVSSGRYDMAVGFYGYTQERSEGAIFSAPYYNERVGYVVLDENQNNSVSFIEDIKDRIDKNFIREDRYKLIVDGFIATIEISFLSVAIGSVLGFGLFMFSRKRKAIEKIALKIDEVFEAVPALVVLLVFFYIIFGKSTISGFTISVMVFSLLFVFTFFKLLNGSVKGIDMGQSEGALALGYSESQTLFKVVIPQALVSFLPAYQSAIVATLKSTAIVGYVAVQDLTRAGDLIRSLTFDAFVPIITVAIIYYAIARVLIRILDKLFTIDLKKNSEKYLKGVKDESN